ncbi:MAG: SlyB protein [Bergeyella zoohelcum]|nr:SlyB protein [Bergeyella zoohelcum]
MKNILFGIGLLGLLISCAGSATSQMQTLKSQEQVLKLNTELNNLKIQREKQSQEVTKLQYAVNKLDAQADAKTNEFSASNSDAATTVKTARKTGHLLKETQKANSHLAKSQEKLKSLDQQILKVQEKLDKLNKGVEFVDKNAK